MAKILANVVVVWALIVSPGLCVAGVIESSCHEPDEPAGCDACSDCVPHSPSCVEDICHQIVAVPARDCPEDMPVTADNEQLDNEVLPAIATEAVGTGSLAGGAWREKPPPGFASRSFTCPLLI